MFEVRTQVDFSAAHHLKGYPGDCARPHGHNWVIEVFVRAQRLDEVGIAVDFKDVKRALKEVVQGWDHQDLNSLPAFQESNPTAENLARHVFTKLQPQLKTADRWLHRVTVWENERSAATYYG